jgi:hypothetical protein
MGAVIHPKEMVSNNSIHPTSWGDVSLVVAELQMYRDGLERFPMQNASFLSLVTLSLSEERVIFVIIWLRNRKEGVLVHYYAARSSP